MEANEIVIESVDSLNLSCGSDNSKSLSQDSLEILERCTFEYIQSDNTRFGFQKFLFADGLFPGSARSFSRAICLLEKAEALDNYSFSTARKNCGGGNSETPSASKLVHFRKARGDRIEAFFPSGLSTLRDLFKNDGVYDAVFDFDLHMLCSFLDNHLEKESIALRKAKRDDPHMKESRIQALMATHLFRHLIPECKYIIDKYSTCKSDCCPCGCGIKLSYQPTGMGHQNVWHGRADVLIGSPTDQVLVTSLTHSDEQRISQLVSQNVVFSFIQAKLRPTKEVMLVPTISCTMDSCVISLFDCKEDILLISKPLPLWLTDKRCEKILNIGTVVILWLVLNYPTTMITEYELGFLDDNCRSGFLKKAEETNVLSIYKENLNFCCDSYCDSDVKSLSYDATMSMIGKDDIYCDIFETSNKIRQKLKERGGKKGKFVRLKQS